MPKLSGVINNQSKSNFKLGVKDTDFLLKLIMRSTFEGSELEVAHSVLTKLADTHRINLEN